MLGREEMVCHSGRKEMVGWTKKSEQDLITTNHNFRHGFKKKVVSI